MWRVRLSTRHSHHPGHRRRHFVSHTSAPRSRMERARSCPLVALLVRRMRRGYQSWKRTLELVRRRHGNVLHVGFRKKWRKNTGNRMQRREKNEREDSWCEVVHLPMQCVRNAVRTTWEIRRRDACMPVDANGCARSSSSQETRDAAFRRVVKRGERSTEPRTPCSTLATLEPVRIVPSWGLLFLRTGVQSARNAKRTYWRTDPVPDRFRRDRSLQTSATNLTDACLLGSFLLCVCIALHSPRDVVPLSMHLHHTRPRCMPSTSLVVGLDSRVGSEGESVHLGPKRILHAPRANGPG